MTKFINDISQHLKGGSQQASFLDWSICPNHKNINSSEKTNFFRCFHRITSIEMIAKIRTSLKEKNQMLYWLNRPNHGLMYMVSGETIYIYDGQEYKVSAGDIMYFPENKKYKGTLLSSTSLCVCINFKIDEPINCAPQVFHLRCENKTQNLFERIHLEWIKSENPYLCMRFLYEILSLLFVLHHYSYSSPQKKQRYDTAKQYIDNHFTEPDLTLESISSAVDISSVYIRKLFSEYAMMSPTEYITFLRISYAKNLLQNAPLSIAQVAEQVGYVDGGYFSKKFKSVTGQSPRDYQKDSKK